MKRALILDNDIYLGNAVQRYIEGKLSSVAPWLFWTHSVRVNSNKLCWSTYQIMHKVDEFNFFEQKLTNNRVRPGARPRRRRHK